MGNTDAKKEKRGQTPFYFARIPIAAFMDAEEFEDYLELQDPEVKRHVAASTKEYREGKSFPAEDLIAESEEKGGAGRGRRR